jgi:hypothetical protein
VEVLGDRTGHQEDIMIRSIGGLATFLLLGSPLWAGELDAEFGTQEARNEQAIRPAKAPAAPRTALPRLDTSAVGQASELDAEEPGQSSRHFGGFGGFHRGFGYGGLGYGRGFGFGRGFGYGGYGYGRGFGYRGFGLGLGLGYGLGYGLGLGYGGLGYGLGYGGYGYGGYGYGGYGYGGYGYGGLGYGPYTSVAYYSPYIGYGYPWGCW